jgi:hypothetical protein
MKASKLKFGILAYLVGTVLIHAAIFWNARDLVRKGYPDFTIYYGAGTMVRQGLGRRLYDTATQFEVQRKFAPEVASRLGALPYNHPPFEAALFVPFTFLPYASAFVLWDLANLAMLISLPFLLRRCLTQLQIYSWPVWLLTCLAFFPIFIALLQGQDSILLLFLYALAFVCLKKNHDVFAGASLAFGLFKPHLVLPFVFLLLVQGRRKILFGFVPIAALMVLISIAIVGRQGVLLYPQYVLHVEDTLAWGAIVPSDMPNLRGALGILFPGLFNRGAAILLLSLGLLVFAARECWGKAANSIFNLRFCLAAVATVLVSYHALVYDLSLLMVPVFLLADDLLGKENPYEWRTMLMMVAVATFFFSPLQVVLSVRGHRAAVLGWVLLLWLFGIAWEISFRTAAEGPANELGHA